MRLQVTTFLTLLALLCAFPATAQQPVIPVSRVTAPVEVVGGQSFRATVFLDQPVQQTSNIPLSTNSNRVSVPSQVQVAQGLSSVDITVITRAVDRPTDVTISAGAYGAVRDVRVRLQPGASVKALQFENRFVTAGEVATLNVVLTRPATQNIIVQLKGSPGTRVPPTVQVYRGQSSVQVSVGTEPSQDTGQAQVSATAGGKTATATVDLIPTPKLTGLTVATPRLEGGDQTTATVSLARAAPVGGALVRLEGPASLELPKTVTVPQGQKERTFPVLTKLAKKPVVATLKAMTPVSSTDAMLKIDLSPSVYAAEQVDYHLMASTKDGVFELEDRAAGARKWRLKRVGESRPSKVSNQEYRALLDMTGHLGDDLTEHQVKLEFTLRGSKDRWTVKRIRILSVDGNVRPE
jgi:hypothetical protein